MLIIRENPIYDNDSSLWASAFFPPDEPGCTWMHLGATPDGIEIGPTSIVRQCLGLHGFGHFAHHAHSIWPELIGTGLPQIGRPPIAQAPYALSLRYLIPSVRAEPPKPGRCLGAALRQACPELVEGLSPNGFYLRYVALSNRLDLQLESDPQFLATTAAPHV